MLIPNDGAAGFEDTVRLDYVMSSPALLKEIKRQLDILDKISSIKSRAEALKKDEAMKEEYFYALFTGVICQSSRKMVYMQTKDGVRREVVLTSDLPKTLIGVMLKFIKGCWIIWNWMTKYARPLKRK